MAEEAGLGQIDLLKIDVEGFDGRVIRGAERLLRERRIRVLQFEYNLPWAAVGDTLAGTVSTLRTHGYETSVLQPTGLAELDPCWGEFFNYSNFVARLA